MSEQLTEEEQIEAFKRWWKENGKFTVAAVVIAGAGYFGFGAYQSAQEKAEQATSGLYDQVITAVTTGGDAALNADQRSAVTAAAEQVLQQDSSGLYADLTRFQLAKMAVDAGEYEEAVSQLDGVIANSKTQSSIELAKLRLARVYAAMGQADEALALLQTAPSDAFAASYAEARGDLLTSLGRLDEAYTAFEAAVSALESQESNTGMRANILKFKMDNTRVASASPLAAGESVGNPHAGMSANTAEASE
ncbi:MAG TPA: tetratricopeptide repeat protein [Marinagarivorans sp.]